MRLTLVFDGEAREPRFRVGWGLSVYLHEANILFDTGEDPEALSQNLKAMGIDAGAIHFVVISHRHFDHVRGIWALKGRSPQVLVAPGLLDVDASRELLGAGFVVSTGDGSSPLFPNIRRLVLIWDGLVEQALLIHGRRGWSILFGCSHGGVDRWLQRARPSLQGPIDLVMGGFHLLDSRSERIDAVIEELSSAGVQRVAPCHCTGPKARGLLREVFGEEGFCDLKVGDTIEI